MDEILKAGRIGKLELKNKIVMLPMGTRYGNAKEGYVTDRLRNYYEERAKGGAGLIIVEIACVDTPTGSCLANDLVIDDDKFIPGLSELAAAIKKHGAKAAIQIGHAGNATFSAITGVQPVAPSAVKRRGLYEIPRELTIEEIQRLVICFAKAAGRAKRAGFDGVEIHGAHLYLVAQFLSSAWNKRQDIYGGDQEKRVRFLLEVINAIREEVGKDFPVWCRINGKEIGIEGGTTLEEAKQTAQMIEASLDALSVTAAASGAYSFVVVSPDHQSILPLATEVKKVVNIPVIAAGRLNPEIGNDALKKGMVDLIGFGRSLIADPDLPRKLSEGKADEIRPCIACLRCYSATDPLFCSVNASAGREKELSIKPAEKPQTVFVVGGGPGGMEAARVAALGGHRVTLFEKSDQLGGQLLLASIPPEKKEMIEPFTHYLTNQVSQYGIKVRMGEEIDRELIDKEKPDVVILATGLTPFVPDIPGVDKPNVVQAFDVLTGLKEVGQTVVIIGGELVACETADLLSGQGKKVTVMRRGNMIASKMQIARRRVLLDRLEAQNVTFLTKVKYEEIIDDGVVISDPEGKRQVIKADGVIIAAGSNPNKKLLEELQVNDGGLKIIQVGDCVEPRAIKEAIEEGFRAALSF
jgi:2,4-dienoyl-CoA reductase-like NADH-dependent reductase (Old Yellow Enzyme family)/thioredoxin reductase